MRPPEVVLEQLRFGCYRQKFQFHLKFVSARWSEVAARKGAGQGGVPYKDRPLVLKGAKRRAASQQAFHALCFA